MVFYVDEETINVVDESIAWDDEEYAQQVITYTEARNALARARIARGFYPVVVPADDGRQPRFGRLGKKGGGKGSPKKKATPKKTPSGPGMSSGTAPPSGGKDGGKRRKTSHSHLFPMWEKRASEQELHPPAVGKKGKTWD